MGLGRELAEEYFFELELLQARMEFYAEKGIWINREGQKIPVVSMSASHIRNCIRMLERKNSQDFYYPYINMFKKELLRRDGEWERHKLEF